MANKKISINPFFSIIVPVYNVEKYVVECLNSLLNQTYKNFEVIIIDDGSPDNSAQIVKNLIQDDTRFKLIQQENKGLGGARNTGLKHAVGNYILFLDSDDYLDIYSLYYLSEHLQVNKTSDVVLFPFYNFDNMNKNIIDHETTSLNIPVNLDNLVHYINDSDTTKHLFNIPLRATNKCYSSKIIKDFIFEEHCYFEDNPVFYFLFAKNCNISYIRNPIYFTRRHNESIMGKIGREKANKYYLDHVKVLDISESFLLQTENHIAKELFKLRKQGQLEWISKETNRNKIKRKKSLKNFLKLFIPPIFLLLKQKIFKGRNNV